MDTSIKPPDYTRYAEDFLSACNMQQNLSQAGQNQQMVNNQMGNNQNMRASLGLQQQLAGMNSAQMPNQMLTGQRMLFQQQQQRQQQRKLQLLRHQSGSIEITPDQVKEIDHIQFPPAILTNNPNMVSPVPKHIKTWGQLKQWVAANPQALGGVDLQKLMTLQKLHLAQIVAQGKEGAVRHMASSPNYSHPPPQYTPRDSYPMQQQAQARQTAKQTEYYSTRPNSTQESANSTRQDEHHHYRTNPNLYHSRDPPCPAPAVDQNASIATQNEYHCHQNNPDFYHHRRDDLNTAPAATQGARMGMRTPTTTEYKLAQVAQQRALYHARQREEALRGRGQFPSPVVSHQAFTTSMQDAYYHRRADQGNLRSNDGT